MMGVMGRLAVIVTLRASVPVTATFRMVAAGSNDGTGTARRGKEPAKETAKMTTAFKVGGTLVSAKIVT